MEVRVERMAGARFEIHARGVTTVVDRLEEQGGPGDGFRPVELLLGSLGACMLGTMLTFAENENIDLGDMSLVLNPVLAEHPERVSRVEMTMRIGGDLSERQLQSLQRVGQRCKIHNTLHQGVETVLTVEPAAAAGPREGSRESEGTT